MGDRRFAPRGPVIDTLADEPVEAIDRKMTPSDAGRENDRPRAQDIAVIEEDLTGRRVYARDGARDQNLRPKSPRLLQGATREFVPGNSVGEPQIVLDPRGCPGLASGCLTLDNDRAHPFGCAVHRRCQASRSAADDYGVVFSKAGAR